MFSGIVERIGRVEGVGRAPDGGARLVIRAGFGTPLAPGQSVAVNGVCLTVEREQEGLFHATAVPETLRRTTLGALAAGARVNLERALRVGDEIGGHWVQGHVDAAARVAAVTRSGADVLVHVEIPEALRPYVAVKGSLALDGASLTVAAWEENVKILLEQKKLKSSLPWQQGLEPRFIEKVMKTYPQFFADLKPAR